MLVELEIADLAVVEHLRLGLEPGLVVLTGETGAGKSIVVEALGLLLGGRADAGAVRAGSPRARVEGVFEADGEVVRLVDELGIDADDGALVVSREVTPEGRSVARVNGRALRPRALQRVGERLVDVHGQSQHLSLLRPAEHIDLLDRHAGLKAAREEVAARVAGLRALRREVDGLRSDARERARRADLFAYQAGEIDAARLVRGEEEELRREQSVLANAERVREIAGAALAALSGAEDGTAGAADLAAEAARGLARLEGIDPRVAPLREEAASAAAALSELAREVRAAAEAAEADPRRLAEVEERLGLLTSLTRKYGDTVEEVIAFGERAASELSALESGGERAAGLERAEAGLLAEGGRLAAELSARRREAARGLSSAIERELAGLGMGGTRFAVRFGCAAADDGLPVPQGGPAEEVVGPGDRGTRAAPPGPRLAFDATGVDRVAFLISPNPGEPLRPLARVASGGETARLMLALKVALSDADPVPTLVFDEIDAGVGGRVGDAVGRKLWELSRRHQVLVVTHLPQIACYAGQHLRVVKRVERGRTVTAVEALAGEGRVSELAAMLGAEGESARRTAETLLERADALRAEASRRP